MLRVGLTGGIGAGKSAVSSRLVELGSALVDADLVAREVVQPDSPGLRAVVDAFGAQVLGADGALDREALGRLVFADPAARARLNGIVHPLVGARSAELEQAAAATGVPVLVHDVPLLVENGLAPAYHLVLVVEAPSQVRVERLVRLRGMTEPDARARMAAQATDEQRRLAADVLLGNGGNLAALCSQLDRLWQARLTPYATFLGNGRPAPRGPVALAAPDPAWPAAGARLAERLRWVCGPRAVRVEHIGSTAVPGLAAKDVVDLQVEVPTLATADELAPVLQEAGFPRRNDVRGDPPRADLDPDPAQWEKRLHLSADPGRPANVHVRAAGSTAARCAVALRDLLRADPQARTAYEADKRRLAALFPDDVDAYAEGKTDLLVPLLSRALRG